MKLTFGIHSYIFTHQWTDGALDLLDVAKELGADVVEIAVGDDVTFTPRLTRQRAESLGVRLTTGPGGAWPLGSDISADAPEERQRGLTWHKRQVDATAEVGAFAYTGAIYGHPGVVKRRVPPSDEFARTAEGLRELAEYAARRGVMIALEPMSHFRTHLVNTPEQLMRLLALADHPNLRAVLDTYHLVTEIRDYRQAILTTQARLIGLHACENDRGVPGGGLIPWETVFAALRDIAFDGYIMLETYNSATPELAFQRGMFHNVCPEARAFARQGFAFLKQCASILRNPL